MEDAMNPHFFKPYDRNILARIAAAALAFVLLWSAGLPVFSQIRVSGVRSSSTIKAHKKRSMPARRQTRAKSKPIIPERLSVPVAATVTSDGIMAEQASRGDQRSARELMAEKGLLRELEGPEREDLPEGPGALPFNRYPYPTKKELVKEQVEQFNIVPDAPQTLGVQFDGATGPAETGAFPPDTMGTVGPSQFVVFLNGRLRSFNKATGVADGVLNVDSDVFFASVVTPPGAGEVSFTSDPQVRYDRLTGRWFLVIIDVVLNSATGAITRPNRVLIAVSDPGSSAALSAGTLWTFYQFQGDATLFTDYESLGVDANALYIGGDMFTIAGAFNSTKGFVIPKAPLLTGAAATVWAFPGLVATPTGAGPFAPRGVDNPDPTNTGVGALGYFIGADNATFNTLMLRRITNPGSLGPAPTISANISIAAPLTTRFPVLVPHLGNTGGTAGRLDSLDDRLYAASLRNGRLWTAHSIGVNNTGVAGATNNRNAARWYEIQNVSATPSVLQSGTLYDNNATNDANQRNYWIPSIAVSGQGHAALGCSIAGTNERVNAFTTGRLAGDTLGTLRNGPGGAALPGYTASASAYNPPGDPGGPSRRWGDYSFTSLDPLDDMTMWTLQEYVNGTNTYSPRVAQLKAPPPATPSSTDRSGGLLAGQASINMVVTGTSTAGSGFFDPGPDLAAPARPFNHISASMSGGVTVNSVTYNSPTQVTLNISTIGATAGPKSITITNPDGQSATGNNLVTILAPTAAGATSAGRVSDSRGFGLRNVAIRIVSQDGTRDVTAITNSFGYYRVDGLPSGQAYLITPVSSRYTFSPQNRLLTLNEDVLELGFTAAP
jgi:hypothetical protein